jgi:hypothetical protein
MPSRLVQFPDRPRQSATLEPTLRSGSRPCSLNSLTQYLQEWKSVSAEVEQLIVDHPHETSELPRLMREAIRDARLVLRMAKATIPDQ